MYTVQYSYFFSTDLLNLQVLLPARCSDLRRRVWEEWVNRAHVSRHPMPSHTNHTEIAKIVELRNRYAKTLGHESFPALCLASQRSARSVFAIKALIDAQLERHRDRALAEYSALCDSAGHKLHAWDVDYTLRRFREATQPADLSASKFGAGSQVDVVQLVRGLFSLARELFGVEIRSATAADVLAMPGTSEHVRVYHLFAEGDPSRPMARFFLDLFARKGKPSAVFMQRLDARCDADGTIPSAYLSLSLPASDAQPKLTLDATVQLLDSFGAMLEWLVCAVPFAELSTSELNLFDSRPLGGQLLKRLVFEVPQIAAHVLPDAGVRENLKRHVRWSGFGDALQLLQELYLSAFELEVYLSGKHWRDVMESLWPRFSVLPLELVDNEPCSLVEVFAQPIALTHYASLWRQMLVANIVDEFQRTDSSSGSSGGSGDERALSGELRALGRRFVRDYMSLAQGVDHSTLCTRFLSSRAVDLELGVLPTPSR